MEGSDAIHSRSNRSGRSRRKKRRIWQGALLLLAIGAAGWLLYEQRGSLGIGAAPEASSSAGSADGVMSESAAPSATPSVEAVPVLDIADFRMLDLDEGWYVDAAGVRMVTQDGGVSWREAGPEREEPADSGMPEASVGSGDMEKTEGETGPSDNLKRRNADAVEAAYLEFDPDGPVYFDNRLLEVGRAQAISGGIGWALAAEGSGLSMPLLVTVDGGKSWHDKVTADVRAAMEEEKQRREQRAEEAVLYASPQQALLAMKSGSGWTLLPAVTYPGDVVLIRSGEPGEVQWQDKSYALQPYKTGYFAYLPIPKSLKPGAYAVGDTQLIVKEKTFKTQHLEVSEEMNSMRQDTERIAADQKKIDAARAASALTFLFDSAFLLPLEGRLTTPFGYTRYINGKLSSSHMALDIAAPQGTPIKATNDGVVALADELLLTGNTIYLDHGMGLFSQYAHLSELHVQAGDQVKKGDVIGLVGTTGFSTGPHLHFTFWAHNVQVNPNLFFDKTPFQWLQEPSAGPSPGAAG